MAAPGASDQHPRCSTGAPHDEQRAIRIERPAGRAGAMKARACCGPQGGGEPSITTTGAVVASAFFDATGVRLDRLPLSAERVRTALAAAA
jgi:CO/xanthine dehydrogenase Mo-binding subunit